MSTENICKNCCHFYNYDNVVFGDCLESYYNNKITYSQSPTVLETHSCGKFELMATADSTINRDWLNMSDNDYIHPAFRDQS